MTRQIIFHGDYFTDFNGFQKKTQKTPVNVIEKAMMIKKKYFESKK